MSQMTVRRWLEWNPIPEDRLLVVTTRIKPELAAKAYFVMPLRPVRKLLYPKLFWDAYRLHQWVMHQTGGNSYQLVTPQISDIPIRYLALHQKCQHFDLVEEGLVSLESFYYNLQARSPIHEVMEAVTGETQYEKFRCAYGYLPIAFEDAPCFKNLQCTPRSVDLGAEVIITVDDLLPSSGYFVEQQQAYQDWVKDVLSDYAGRCIGIKFHPNILKSEEKLRAFSELWSQIIPGTWKVITERLDDVQGEGRVMLGTFSSMLLYAKYNGWQIRRPVENELLSAMPQSRLLDRLIEKLNRVKNDEVKG